MLISRSDWKTQPWKNQRGITHEIWRYQRDNVEQSDDYDLRLSIAEIDGAQPFSAFAGYHRVLFPLQDSTLLIDVAGKHGQLLQHMAVEFSGDDVVATTGVGHAIDLNIIQRGAAVNYHVGLEPPAQQPHSVVAVFALQPCTLIASSAPQRLGEFDTWISCNGDILRTDAVSVWVWQPR
jgi:environmental stress-induced protein Ves